jgi:two-component system, cell cycle response regulator
MKINREIVDGIYWVGSIQKNADLVCNPYLVVDGEEAVLIDPGNVLDFEDVYKNVTEIVPIEKIKYVILSHQDPDLCSSVTLFEDRGLNAKIVTYWRTSVILKYYGIKSEMYLVNETDYKLTLSTGRVFTFILAAYLHFPGSIATYDEKSETLFTGDLFASFSQDKWNLYANDSYLEPMKAFHEHYMPGNEILRPVMEVFLGLNVKFIAPQHGSVIKDDVKKFITTLRDLECGTLLNPIKKTIAKTGGYIGICNKILKRLYAVFTVEEVKAVFDGTSIILDEKTNLIKDFNLTGENLWQEIFVLISTKKGFAWLEILEVIVRKFVSQYDLEYPSVYQSLIFDAQKHSQALNEENKRLQALTKSLKNNLKETEEQLNKCDITGFYNHKFFKQYLENEVKNNQAKKLNSALFLIDIDNMTALNFKYGYSISNKIIKKMAQILEGMQKTTHSIFKLEGAVFAYYVPDVNQDEASEFAEELRIEIANSKLFIEQITVSIGIANLQEITKDDFGVAKKIEVISNKLYNLAKVRVSIAKKRGMNRICYESSLEEISDDSGKILIVDTDTFNLDILKTYLENAKYEVFICRDGISALEVVEKENPSLIISEIMIPKLDGFAFKHELLSISAFKDIPFILISNNKDEDLVLRAQKLKIKHYLKKPYMLSELIGKVENLLN